MRHGEYVVCLGPHASYAQGYTWIKCEPFVKSKAPVRRRSRIVCRPPASILGGCVASPQGRARLDQYVRRFKTNKTLVEHRTRSLDQTCGMHLVDRAIKQKASRRLLAVDQESSPDSQPQTDAFLKNIHRGTNPNVYANRLGRFSRLGDHSSPVVWPACFLK